MYKYYPEELIEEIRMSNDILSVVGEYVKLERKGKNYFGLCPFHSEKTPSFSVDPNKQLYYCFGCGKGGSVIQFVMEVENLDYIEAVKMLAERARIQLPEGDNEEERDVSRAVSFSSGALPVSNVSSLFSSVTLLPPFEPLKSDNVLYII